MLHTTNIISQHPATLHCVWVPVHTGADAPLAAVWIDTPQSDFCDQEHQERSSDGRCCATQTHVTGSSVTLQAMERRTGERKLQTYREVSELIDPRPIDGSRLSYNGKPLLPVSYECKWMSSNHMLQRAVIEQLFVIGSEGKVC